jgi:hypothetical protein
MKKIILLAAIIISFGTSCKKDEVLLPQAQDAVGLSDNNSVGAVPINFSESVTVSGSTWNNCADEFIDFSGIGHVQVHGVISNNKITYILHYNASGVKGYGRTTGTEYVTTQAFNYSNTYNFNTQYVYQQRSTINFIAKGKDGSFTVEDNWHLTVNANGDVTFFFTTGGVTITCR